MAHSPRTERQGRPAALALAVVLAGLAQASSEPSAELAFTHRGEPVAVLDLAALRRAVEPAQVRVLEPYEDGEATFDALPLVDVLDAVYGRGWRDEEELLFTCRDGYQPTVPVARALSHRAWLAFDRVDTEGFAIRKRESGSLKRVELGPFYLVWENLEDAQIRLESDYGWPYQLVGIDLIRSADRFPKLAPPAGASESVRAGFAAYRVHCSKCHMLNGEGGNVGPELNAPARPLADRDSAWLRAWIAEPESIRPDTRMEPLNPKLPDRERVVEAIIAYLHAMVGAKPAPEAR